MGAIMQDRIARVLERFEREADTLEEIAQRMGGAVVGEDGLAIFEGLPQICRAWDVPYGRVLSWLMADAERYAVYQRCLEVQAHQLVSEAVGIADDTVNDVARDKLRVDTRFRVAKHHASKVYGEKVEHTGLSAPVFNVVINGALPSSPSVDGPVVSVQESRQPVAGGLGAD